MSRRLIAIDVFLCSFKCYTFSAPTCFHCCSVRIHSKFQTTTTNYSQATSWNISHLIPLSYQLFLFWLVFACLFYPCAQSASYFHKLYVYETYSLSFCLPTIVIITKHINCAGVTHKLNAFPPSFRESCMRY